MKKFSFFLAAIFLFIIFFFGIKLFLNFNNSRELKIEKKKQLRKSAEVLNKCFDLENKSERTIDESMKLIEYCLNNYGSKN
tara:strand:+ start:171 stop:413 length:243 start_codon:yes stop_codon:yes gene_type:complete